MLAAEEEADEEEEQVDGAVRFVVFKGGTIMFW